jgi:hypothetical protein
MDDRNAIAIGIVDDTDFRRLTIRRWSDEHRDVRIISLEASPVVSECMQHVVIGDTVLAGAGLDVHLPRLRTKSTIVNIC